MCGCFFIVVVVVFELCFFDCVENSNDLAIKQKYFKFY